MNPEMIQAPFVSRPDFFEKNGMEFSADASQLQWKPGFFPPAFVMLGEVGTIVFRRRALTPECAHYTSAMGATAIVYND